jgi:two-component system, LytTR family, response regulator
MTTLKSIIIEDEEYSRECLINYLKEYCEDVQIVGTADTIGKGYEIITTVKPEIVFLDIQLPDGLAFELLNKFHNIDFKVIFTTGHSEFAAKAFRFCAVDFLLKPIRIDELIEAVSKVREELLHKVNIENIRSLLKFANSGQNEFDRLVVHELKGFHVLELKDIIYCQAEGYCTLFQLTGNHQVVSSKLLKYYEDLLDESHFLRVHNSYLLNLKHVKNYHSQGIIELTGSFSVPLGNTYRKRFIENFDHLR